MHPNGNGHPWTTEQLGKLAWALFDNVDTMLCMVDAEDFGKAEAMREHVLAQVDELRSALATLPE